jgi:hypothetical protein
MNLQMAQLDNPLMTWPIEMSSKVIIQLYPYGWFAYIASAQGQYVKCIVQTATTNLQADWF